MFKSLKTALVASAFVIAMFVVLEISYRVYLFGPAGFSPAKVGSFSLIFSSGLVQPAENRDIWYELKPNQNTLFRGVPFRTNSQGLADDEYAVEKPANTIRVAVVGSSWTMGAAVELQDAYHSVLERQFNSAGGVQRYEFINFGVEFYGLQEIIATIRHKVLRYDPDFILLEVTAHTPYIRWAVHDTDFVPAPYRNRAWDSMLLQTMAGRLGFPSQEIDVAKLYRQNLSESDWDAYFAQIARAFDELAEISKASGIPAAAALLHVNERKGNFLGSQFLAIAAVKNVSAADVNLSKLLQPGETPLTLLVSRVEPHPNAYGHELIAAELRRLIFDANPLLQIPAEK